MTARHRFDVELVKTSFEGAFWESLALVRSSDIILGMHGAGFTNLLGIHKVSLVAMRMYCLLHKRVTHHDIFSG